MVISYGKRRPGFDSQWSTQDDYSVVVAFNYSFQITCFDLDGLSERTGVAEAVLKTVCPKGCVGSNPTPSAR